MINALPTELTFYEVARRSQEALHGLWEGILNDIAAAEDLQNGIALLELLERVAQEFERQPPSVEESDKNQAYRRVRQEFYAEQVSPDAPSYVEWDMAVHQEFRIALETLMRDSNVSEGKAHATAVLRGWESQEGSTRDQVQGALNTFTSLALLCLGDTEGYPY